jgi:hypothetical protein
MCCCSLARARLQDRRFVYTTSLSCVLGHCIARYSENECHFDDDGLEMLLSRLAARFEAKRNSQILGKRSHWSSNVHYLAKEIAIPAPERVLLMKSRILATAAAKKGSPLHISCTA